MREQLRYGILGSGFMGRTHAEAIRHLPNATLSAVACGRRAPQLAQDYGAEEVIVVTITFDHEARKRSYTLLAEAFGLPGTAVPASGAGASS